MKRIILFSVLFSIAGLAKLKAQCSAANLNVVVKSVTSGPSGCQVTLDMSFTGNFNNGNKYAFIHLWETAPVNYYPQLTYTSPPTAAQLANAVASIVIVDPGKSSAALYNEYPPNTAIPVKYAGVNFTKTGNLYTLTNVVINFSTCNVPVTVKGDVWASQSDYAQVVHCNSDGIITILFNNPVITGNKQCSSPRLLDLNFRNEHPSLSVSVTASVFIDVNNNGSIDANDIDITGSLSPAIPNPMNIGANSAQTFTGLTYLPYSIQPQYHNSPIIVRANATAPGAATVTITKNNINYTAACSLLPVSFQSFTAAKESSKVVLKWETASEQNNRGFIVERNSDGTWVSLTSVPSKAANGNSQAILQYRYEDSDNLQGQRQYRIKQVDFDGTSSYSEIRTVAENRSKNEIKVFPNPSQDGKVNVRLNPSRSPRDIQLLDMAGRPIRKWNSTTSTQILIDNLLPGMYTLRVLDRESGAYSTEKIMVHRR